MRDRDIDAAVRKNAAYHIQQADPPVNDWDDVLDFCIDAMEQAKFKVPKHSGRQAKSAANLWRPQLHCTGVTIAGLRETFYLSSCTLPKNASTQVTMILDAIQQASKDLKTRGRTLPKILRLVSDNASAETKNQHVMKVMAWLVYTNCFSCVEMSQFRPGHTHNDQDRAFSRLGTAIQRFSQNGTLEIIEDFQSLITDKVKSPLPLHQHVNIIKGAWEWTDWTKRLDINVEGHTSTQAKKQRNEAAVHNFRFVKRKDLEGAYQWREIPTIPTEIIDTAWPELVPDDNDIILCTKQYVQSLQLSQPPLVFAPSSEMQKLQASEVQPACLVPLGERLSLIHI